MPIRFNVYWLMIAVAIAAGPMAIYAGDPQGAVEILAEFCVLCVPPAAVSLIVTTIRAIRSRARGLPMKGIEIAGEFVSYGLFGFVLWVLLGFPLFTLCCP
jgi:hypothetical protein